MNGYLKKEREQRVSKELGSSGSRKLMRKMSNKELI